ncbi:hypothetical protein TNIN_238391 [Trichonephila inaurata madagascariensis]|uniref:Uncharacterized protein n=1 Tax=Trichonephila inaurata madagascariensis TaxID=2747483 RepID=A0A8X6WZ19_9ARAC|nr:hypothetical protein TNIN_238391 [Trichonephila inaurata madagascariensis]
MHDFFLDSVWVSNPTKVGANLTIQAKAGFISPQKSSWQNDVNHHWRKELKCKKCTNLWAPGFQLMHSLDLVGITMHFLRKIFRTVEYGISNIRHTTRKLTQPSGE